jgi:pimeloyl-ACP methyl ester carboxylesterase
MVVPALRPRPSLRATQSALSDAALPSRNGRWRLLSQWSMRSLKSEAPAIILVHGAWMDGSSWREVIALLQKKGWDAAAVQNPLTSFAEDVNTVIRIIERQRNGVVLVGHGYGGSVISQAGMHAKVAGLVYVAAIAPDVGESSADSFNSLPNSVYAKLLEADAQGFSHLPRDAFVDHFAHDLPNTESRVLEATQVPIHERALSAKLTASAAHSKPAFYVLTEKDRMISPEAQQHFIECTRAKTAAISTGHVPFLSKPPETTELILEGIRSITARRSRRNGR